MYQIYCDGFLLFDPRMDKMQLLGATCDLEVNTVCGANLSIQNTHPNYGVMEPLRSIFEIIQGNHVLFRGRMTDNSREFYKRMDVDLEGILAVTNDTVIPPFIIEGQTISWGDQTQTLDGNVVEAFLGWIIDRHNEYAQPWQQLKLGTVLVEDPNNVITRSSESYLSTLEVLKSRLFESALGGYLYVRYEADGNYIDYVNEFVYTNTQKVVLGSNMLDLNIVTDATATYSAILPIGKDGLTLEDGDLPDGDLGDGMIKKGVYIYSQAAVDKYGWVCVPLNESKKDDITTVDGLKDWAKGHLNGTAMLLTTTRTIKAVDMSLTDVEIQELRAYRKVRVDAPAHGINDELFPLPKLHIDLLDPQNTTITLGDTKRSLIDANRELQENSQLQIEAIKNEVKTNNETIVNTVKEQTIEQMTQVISQCNEIILSALESYVETSDFEEYRETVSTQLQILSDEILMQFTSVTEHITEVDGDAQSKFTEIYKYISFADGNITIGSSENAITLTIENDMIVFKKNGLQFGWWDGVDFHTGNIVVEVSERAQFGNFAFIPRSDGSLMFSKVGG